MPALTLVNGLLRVDGCGGPLVVSASAQDPCCCDVCNLCQNINVSLTTYSVCGQPGAISGPFGGICCVQRAPGILKHRVIIPANISLPVQLNISGGANDDVLLDEQSITDELNFDPFPYPSALSPCIGAHEIASGRYPDGRPGPFFDPVNGGITFPWHKRDFIVSCRDTIGFGAALDIRICVNPVMTLNLFSPGGDWSALSSWFLDRAFSLPAHKVPDQNTHAYVYGDMTGTGVAKRVYVNAPVVTPIEPQPVCEVNILFSPGGAWDSPDSWFLDPAFSFPANRIPDAQTTVYIYGDMTGSGVAKNVYVDPPFVVPAPLIVLPLD